MTGEFIPDDHWMARLSPALESMVDDVQWACARARMHKADRRGRSRPTWRKAMRAFRALRRACTAAKPRPREIRRLAGEAEKLYDEATALALPPEEPKPDAVAPFEAVTKLGRLRVTVEFWRKTPKTRGARRSRSPRRSR